MNLRALMETNETKKPDDEPGVFAEAKALAAAILFIRRAQGKSNPVDFEIGSEAWEKSVKEFAGDVLRLPPEELKRFAPLVRRDINRNTK